MAAPRLDPELLRAWDAEQAALAARVMEADPAPQPAVAYVGGLDISFLTALDDGADAPKEKEETAAVAALVVLSYPALEPVYEDLVPVTLTQPYAAGYLAFREAPALVELVGRLRARRPDLVPQVLMVDGNGVLHTRGCGLACHVGLATGIPTIGVAKTFLHVDGLDAHGVREAVDAQREGAEGGDWLPLVGESGRTWGAALRPQCQDAPIRNPIYVSVGTDLSLETAVDIVRTCCRHRVPEPIRQADIRSRARIREEQEKQGKKAR